MAIDYRLVALGALALGGLLAGVYGLNMKQAEPPAAARAPLAQSPQPAPSPLAQPPQPAPSPVQAPAGAQPSEPLIEGKVGASEAPNAGFTHFRVGNRNVKRIFIDGDKVWVGTSGGVIRYSIAGDEYKLYDARSGLLSNAILYVGKLRGRIVAGTNGGGMSLLDPGSEKWETYNAPEGLGDAFVHDVLEASNGDAWIATRSGAYRVRGGALRDRSKWQPYTVESTKSGLPDDRVYGLAEGRNGDIWLATHGGMARYRKGAWESWDHAKGLGAPYEKVKEGANFKTDPARVPPHPAKQKEATAPRHIDIAYDPNYIVSLAVDRAGTVWAGTWGAGLARYDGKQWKNQTTAEGLPGNHVFMLHLDAEGRLWIGTNNGLARMQGGKFKVLTTRDGLFANAVFSMASSGKSIWVGGFGGVAQIRRID